MYYIVNRKIDRKFETFEEALDCAIDNLPIHKFSRVGEYWKVKKTPKGWSVTINNPRKYNNCTYTCMQFIQQINENNS